MIGEENEHSSFLGRQEKSAGEPSHPGHSNPRAANALNNPQRPAAPGGRLAWSVAALGLLVLLGWQVRYGFLEKYAQHPQYRPFMTVGCAVFNCALLPQRRDLMRLTMIHTHIDLHPLEPGAIRITVKLVNEALFAQPWPDLQITLTDRDGRIVGRRVFPPARYLAQSQLGQLGSGELGVARFDLARPYEKAVGFEVDVVAPGVSS